METAPVEGSGAVTRREVEEKNEQAHRKGACCLSEHKDRKSIKEKERAGREGTVGV